jgi:hypothetical protein
MNHERSLRRHAPVVASEQPLLTFDPGFVKSTPPDRVTSLRRTV